MIRCYDEKKTEDALMYVQGKVHMNELWMNLAEECSELAQASLKMCRVDSMTNPTDKTFKEAYADVVEEYTDILNIADRLLRIRPDWGIGNEKIIRWADRIKERIKNYD